MTICPQAACGVPSGITGKAALVGGRDTTKPIGAMSLEARRRPCPMKPAPILPPGPPEMDRGTCAQVGSRRIRGSGDDTRTTARKWPAGNSVETAGETAPTPPLRIKRPQGFCGRSRAPAFVSSWWAEAPLCAPVGALFCSAKAESRDESRGATPESRVFGMQGLSMPASYFVARNLAKLIAAAERLSKRLGRA